MEMMHQEAPWPQVLEDLVKAVKHRKWSFWLSPDMDRGQGSKGTTLVIQIDEPDAYHPEKRMVVNHLFPVPPAAYDMRSWRRWLFDRIGDVDTHERCENFQIDGEHPYAPSHGFGQDPYLIREIGTDLDQKTSFRNKVRP